MKINKNNYEEYAIDYLDGTLSPQLIKAFESFLRANPEVAEELKGMKEAVLNPELTGGTVLFEKKEEMYKNSPLVAILNRPFQFRMWQVAASLLLLLSAAWIGMEVYTPQSGSLQVAEVEAPKQEVPAEITPKDPVVAAAYTSSPSSEQLRGEKVKESTPPVVSKKQPAVVEGEKEEVFIAEAAVVSAEEEKVAEEELEPEQEIQAEEAYVFIDLTDNVKKVLCEAAEAGRVNQSPSSISSLPARSIQLLADDENRPTICEKRMPADFNKKGANEETAGSFLVRLADRVVPFPLAEWIDPSNININTDRIPQSLLPEMVKQNSL